MHTINGGKAQKLITQFRAVAGPEVLSVVPREGAWQASLSARGTLPLHGLIAKQTLNAVLSSYFFFL